MLSRAADERVFRGSQDVVVGRRSTGSRSSRYGGLHARQTGLTMSSEQPMELVFFPNGEIRPRDECPAGMALPPPVNTRMIANHEHVYEDRQHHQQFSSNEQQRRYRPAKQTRPMQEARDTPNVRPTSTRNKAKAGTNQAPHRSRQVSRSHSPSSSSSLSFSDEDHDESSSDRDGFASKSSYSDSGDVSSDSDAGQQQKNYQDQRDQKHREPQRRTTARPALAVNHLRHRPISNLRVRTASPERVSTKRAETFDRVEEMNGTRKTTPKNVRMALKMRSRSPTRASTLRQSPAGSSTKRYEPAIQVDSSKVHAKANGREPSRQKNSEISSDEENAERKTSRTHSIDSRTVKRLEQELMKERERVLTKMTQLLEEQGKTQQLREQIERHEAQMEETKKLMELKVKEANDQKEQIVKAVESKWRKSVKAIEDQLHVKDAAVLRLESEIEQLKVMSSKKASESNNQKREKESLAKQDLEGMIARMSAFHTQVERWKDNSKEAMECCDRKADMLGLLNNVWMDFPRFSEIDIQHFKHQKHETRNQGSNNDANEAESETANMVQFLKKKLRVREDELRQMHVKYVELKELCAAQCIREADLQNFINEHRLRGNLTFNKDARRGDGMDARKNVHFHEQPQRNGARAAPTIVTRGTNTPTYSPAEYSDEEELHEVDNQIASGDEDYVVREPKVFVQVGRDGVYEHTSHRSSSAVLKKLEEQERARKKSQHVVERIRLVPSATLAERYERVPTPTSDNAASMPKRHTNRSSGISTSAARRAIGGAPSSRHVGTVKKRPTASVPGRGSSRAATSSSRAAASLRPWT